MRKDCSDQHAVQYVAVELPAANYIKQNKVVPFGKFVVHSSYRERPISDILSANKTPAKVRHIRNRCIRYFPWDNRRLDT